MPTPRPRHPLARISALRKSRMVNNRKNSQYLVAGLIGIGELPRPNEMHSLQCLKGGAEEGDELVGRVKRVSDTVLDEELAGACVLVGAVGEGDLVEFLPLVRVGEAAVLQFLGGDDLRHFGRHGRGLA